MKLITRDEQILRAVEAYVAAARGAYAHDYIATATTAAAVVKCWECGERIHRNQGCVEVAYESGRPSDIARFCWECMGTF